MRRVAIFLLGILPVVLLILNSNRGWHRDDGLWMTHEYLINVGLFFFIGLELLFFAFLASKAERRLLAGLCLSLAPALFCLGTFDLYVLLLNRDTTGPGGRLCLTHRNWYDHLTTNELGYWEKDLSAFVGREQRSDPLVVAAVGDSFTFGQGLMSAEHRYTNRLSQSLEGIEVLNFSQGGYSTRDEISEALPNVKTINPDVVLLFYLSNDIHDAIGMKHRPPIVRSKWQHRLLVGSPTCNFLYWRFLAGREFAAFADGQFEALQARYLDQNNFAEHQADLQKFADEVRKMGAKPAAVILPFPHFWTNTTPEMRTKILDKIEIAMKESGMSVLNAAEIEKSFPVGSFEVNSMDGHPKAEAHQAIADLVAPWLEKLTR